MPADAGIDRAVVHAGAAANAAQRRTQLRVRVDARAAVVQQHQMHLARAVCFVLLARAGDHVDVGGHCLAGGASSQQRQQRGQIVQPRDHLLDAGDGDVHIRRGGAHTAVALVLHQAQRAGLGDCEVDAGQADPGAAKLLAHHAPGGCGKPPSLAEQHQSTWKYKKTPRFARSAPTRGWADFRNAHR